ncbi:MAG TPA: hypothetical protein VGG24_21575 [Paraburkholderia sp.]
MDTATRLVIMVTAITLTTTTAQGSGPWVFGGAVAVITAAAARTGPVSTVADVPVAEVASTAVAVATVVAVTVVVVTAAVGVVAVHAPSPLMAI